MPRPNKLPGQERFQVSISIELAKYLDVLVEKGLHGNTRQEVLRHLAGEMIAILEDRGFFDKPPREPLRK